MTNTTSARIIRNDDEHGNRWTEDQRYPKSDAHTWNAFAGLAIELGGYNDATVIDPYSGDQLYVPDLPKAEGDEISIAALLRAIADAAEATGFGQ